MMSTVIIATLQVHVTTAWTDRFSLGKQALPPVPPPKSRGFDSPGQDGCRRWSRLVSPVSPSVSLVRSQGWYFGPQVHYRPPHTREQVLQRRHSLSPHWALYGKIVAPVDLLPVGVAVLLTFSVLPTVGWQKKTNAVCLLLSPTHNTTHTHTINTYPSTHTISNWIKLPYTGSCYQYVNYTLWAECNSSRIMVIDSAVAELWYRNDWVLSTHQLREWRLKYSMTGCQYFRKLHVITICVHFMWLYTPTNKANGIS